MEQKQKNYGDNFFWILGGIRRPEYGPNFIYYIIPSTVMSRNLMRRYKNWLNTPARDGSKHKEISMRTVDVPPCKPRQQNLQWDFSEYKNRWDLIKSKPKY